MYCNKCGNKIDESKHSYCSFCGEKIQFNQQDNSINSNSVQVSNNKRNLFIGLGVFVVLLIAALFLVPIPYSTTVTYTTQEPFTAMVTYTDTEPYTVQEAYKEQVPMTVEECKADITANPTTYLNRGIDNLDALLKGNINVLLQTCKDVIKYNTETKYRDVIKYRTVQKQKSEIQYKTVEKERQETKTATAFMFITGQVTDQNKDDVNYIKT
jgi:hypothetical protein